MVKVDPQALQLPAEVPAAAAEPSGVPAHIGLNDAAPDFEAETTHGTLRLSRWQEGKWVILFSHPADFTAVCTSELVEFGRRWEEFQRREVALLGISVDSVYSHIAWIRSIEQHFQVKIPFPVIADLDQRVSRLYGMIHAAASRTTGVRCVYFIDPRRTIRGMIYYPLNVGRSFDEILRVIDALQTVDRYAVACPADWQPGQEVVVSVPVTCDEAAERAASHDGHVIDWYFAKRRL